MATERAFALAAIVAMSCSPVNDRCRSGTLLVTVTLAGTTASADQLVVDVALDGGAPHESTLAHAPGQPAGNVLVQFPSGYPRGHRIDVGLTASAEGVVLGSASAGVTLADDCAVATLTVDEGGGGDDLAVADDLGGSDLASADLTSAPDLATGPDLWTGCVPTGVENCFNGIDDDCNGHIDCDDGACAPIARCVPTVAGPFAYVTQEPSNGACPTDTTSGGTHYASNPSGGGCNAGGCGCDTHGCSTTALLDVNCPSGSGSGTVGTAVNDVCNMSLHGLNNLYVPPPTGTISCASNGSATPVSPPVLTKMLECGVSAVGAGCTSGHVCAPIGAQQCVAAGGAQTCPAGYPTGATWYSSFTDNRVCSCSCAPSSCGAAGLIWWSSTDCSGTSHSQGNDICSNDYYSTKIAGGCAPSASLGATSIQFNGASTVCCE
jgi:hypothetical protein